MNNGLILAVMRAMRKQKNSKIPVDILVIGTGNIAKRHIQNLQKLFPLKTIYVLKRSHLKIDKFFNKSGIKLISSLNRITAANRRSLALICSPAIYHVKDIKSSIDMGFNIFTEKPLMTRNQRISLLLEKLSTKKLLTHVGYNMRFTNRIKYIKNKLLDKKISDIQGVEIVVYTDFRKWRKNKNYKDTVSFDKSLGGGVINELSHEVDYMIYLFGIPKSVKVLDISTHNLDSNVELNIKASFNYRNKLDISLCANMLSPSEKRLCTIVSKNNVIKIDHISNKIWSKNKKITDIQFNDSNDDSYISEIKYIYKCLSKNIKSMLSVKSIIPTQLVLNAMHSSLRQNRRIYIQ